MERGLLRRGGAPGGAHARRAREQSRGRWGQVRQKNAERGVVHVLNARQAYGRRHGGSEEANFDVTKSETQKLAEVLPRRVDDKERERTRVEMRRGKQGRKEGNDERALRSPDVQLTMLNSVHHDQHVPW